MDDQMSRHKDYRAPKRRTVSAPQLDSSFVSLGGRCTPSALQGEPLIPDFSMTGPHRSISDLTFSRN
jgi:hypothetical protein